MATTLIVNDRGRISFVEVDFLVSNEDPGQPVVALRVVGLHYAVDGDSGAPLVTVKRRGIAALRLLVEASRCGITAYDEAELAAGLFNRCAPGKPVPEDWHSFVAKSYARFYRFAAAALPVRPDPGKDPVTLQLGKGLIPLIDPEASGNLLDRVAKLRQELSFSPPIRIQVYDKTAVTGKFRLSGPFAPTAARNQVNLIILHLKMVLVAHQGRFAKGGTNGG